MDRLLGVKVTVTTILDNKVSGSIYSYCPVTSTLTLMEDGPQGSTGFDYRVMKLSFIRDITVVDKKSSVAQSLGTNGQDTFIKAEPKIGKVSLKEAVHKETSSVKNAREARYIKGVGVTQEGQQIFMALYKTLPCRWHEKSIIVMDEVRIDAPYTTESCKAANESSNALALVRKMVAGAWEKLEVKGG